LKFFVRWASTNKSEQFLRAVINRFAYSDQRSSFSNIQDDMVNFINQYHQKIQQLLLDVSIVVWGSTGNFTGDDKFLRIFQRGKGPPNQLQGGSNP
jgi:hypothetical protein